MTDARPSPDALLRLAAREGRGRLKIFLGAAPGVGKTFEMLREGAERLRDGLDVVVGVVETHGRAETEALVGPFEVLARRTVAQGGATLGELDLDALLARRPALALVDELAHSNAPGSRHAKRWQDVEELLDAGIDVYSTLNVQHVESLGDVVTSVTRVRVRETVPDRVLDSAELELVDLPPDELIDRLKAGKVYVPAEASRALGHFFSKANLSALRELALRRAALSVDRAMLDHLDGQALAGAFPAGERVLVAVSELPGADTLVRAGKRLADALRAPWQVAFVETPRAERFDAAARQRVADALQLASALGGTVATIPAETVADGLRQHVVATRATQLVIGKSRRSWWFELRHGSVVARMLALADGPAVHVIPAEQAGPRPRGASGDPGWGALPALALALLLVAVTTALGRAAELLIGAGGVDLLYLLPVVGAAWRGVRSGLVAAVAAGLAYNFFFLPPLYTFTIADPHSLLTMFVLIGVALIVAGLTGRLQTRAAIGARSAQENAAVAAFGQALARVSDWQGTGEVVCAELSRLLGVSVAVMRPRDGALFRVAACPDDLPGLGAVEEAAAEWAWNRGEPAGAGTGTLAGSEWRFEPLRTTLGVLAVVGLVRADGGAPVDPRRAVLLSTLLGQAALAHERLRLEDDLREVTVLRERDRMRAALLSSIGHDLRTPMTGVAAAIDAVAAEHPGSASVALARAEQARLRRFLDNLVEMVRLDTGAVQVALEPVDLTDACAAAVHDLRDVLAGREIVLGVPPDLPLVQADPRLLHHVLLNLIGNAVVHGAGAIELIGESTPATVRLLVRDHGPGLRADVLDNLGAFGIASSSDRRGGTGLGLAIARSFSEVMAATLVAASTADGAVFEISFQRS